MMKEILDEISQSLSVAVGIKTVPLNGRISDLEKEIKKLETKQNKYHERYESLVTDLADGKQVIKSILKANQEYLDNETAIGVCREAINILNNRIGSYSSIRKHAGLIDRTAITVLGLSKTVLSNQITGMANIDNEKRLVAERGSLDNKRTALLREMEALDLDTKDMIKALDELVSYLDNYGNNKIKEVA